LSTIRRDGAAGWPAHHRQMRAEGERVAQRMEVRLDDERDVVVVPEAVINDHDLSPADVGIYVQLAVFMKIYLPPHGLEHLIEELARHLSGRADREFIEASLQRLADNGHVWIFAKPSRDR